MNSDTHPFAVICVTGKYLHSTFSRTREDIGQMANGSATDALNYVGAIAVVSLVVSLKFASLSGPVDCDMFVAIYDRFPSSASLRKVA